MPVDDVRQIRRLGIVKNLQSDEGYFETNALCNHKPMIRTASRRDEVTSQ